MVTAGTIWDWNDQQRHQKGRGQEKERYESEWILKHQKKDQIKIKKSDYQYHIWKYQGWKK